MGHVQEGATTTNEIGLSVDRSDFQGLSADDEQHFISHVLTFFVTVDGIVNVNMLRNFVSAVRFSEARCASKDSRSPWKTFMQRLTLCWLLL
jgi:ribonucleotide reductase beta subunit family protein with ferritin-like domain